MNREIKFRGKKTQTNEWVYGSLILSTNNQPSCITAIKENPVSNGVLNYWCFGVETNSIGEYTGLKDKNGKEIYEGDVLKSWYSRDMSGKDIVHMTFEVEHEVIEGTGTSGFQIEFLNNAEIIGNVYANPELLNN